MDLLTPENGTVRVNSNFVNISLDFEPHVSGNKSPESSRQVVKCHFYATQDKQFSHSYCLGGSTKAPSSPSQHFSILIHLLTHHHRSFNRRFHITLLHNHIITRRCQHFYSGSYSPCHRHHCHHHHYHDTRLHPHLLILASPPCACLPLFSKLKAQSSKPKAQNWSSTMPLPTRLNPRTQRRGQALARLRAYDHQEQHRRRRRRQLPERRRQQLMSVMRDLEDHSSTSTMVADNNGEECEMNAEEEVCSGFLFFFSSILSYIYMFWACCSEFEERL